MGERKVISFRAAKRKREEPERTLREEYRTRFKTLEGYGQGKKDPYGKIYSVESGSLEITDLDSHFNGQKGIISVQYIPTEEYQIPGSDVSLTLVKTDKLINGQQYTLDKSRGLTRIASSRPGRLTCVDLTLVSGEGYRYINDEGFKYGIPTIDKLLSLIGNT